MGWLSELGGPVDPFNQSVVVSVPAGLDEDRLTHALQTLIDHHDVLRLRVDERWNMDIPEPGSTRATDCLVRYDATSLDEEAIRTTVTTQAQTARDRLATATGHMLQAVWIDRGSAQDGLLILVAHHLVVDTVTWRLLVPDLHDAFGNQPLPPTGTSWRQWATTLHQHAQSPTTESELTHWRTTLDRPTTLHLDPHRDTHANAAHLTLDLDPETTEALLTWVPGIYRAEINDLLLTAFAIAVADWRRTRGEDPDAPVTIDLESHGRHEDTVPGAELSRTAGWFTSMHPVQLNPAISDWTDLDNAGPTTSQALRHIKEQLRQTPGDGLGFGLLRYLNPDTRTQLAELPAPEYGFNYLGRFTGGGGGGGTSAGTGGPAAWSVIGRGVAGQHPDIALAHPVELVAGAHDTEQGPQLHSVWTYATALLSEDAVRQLGEGWFKALELLVEHARKPEASGLTPSDVSLTSLSEDDIARLESEWGSF